MRWHRTTLSDESPRDLRILERLAGRFKIEERLCALWDEFESLIQNAYDMHHGNSGNLRGVMDWAVAVALVRQEDEQVCWDALSVRCSMLMNAHLFKIERDDIIRHTDNLEQALAASRQRFAAMPPTEGGNVVALSTLRRR